MYLIGVVAMGLFGFLYFGMVDTAVPALVFIAIVLSLIPHDMQYGPQAALIAESFTPRLRYSGASLGYQLASIIAGGPAPLIATALFAAYHSGYAIAIYIAVLRRHQLDRGGDDAGLSPARIFRPKPTSRTSADLPRSSISRPRKLRARFRHCWNGLCFVATAPRRSADRSGACGPCRHRAAWIRRGRRRCRDRRGRRLPGRRR